MPPADRGLMHAIYTSRRTITCTCLVQVHAPRPVARVALRAHADPEGHALAVEEGEGVLYCVKYVLGLGVVVVRWWVNLVGLGRRLWACERVGLVDFPACSGSRVHQPTPNPPTHPPTGVGDPLIQRDPHVERLTEEGRLQELGHPVGAADLSVSLIVEYVC